MAMERLARWLRPLFGAVPSWSLVMFLGIVLAAFPTKAQNEDLTPTSNDVEADMTTFPSTYPSATVITSVPVVTDTPTPTQSVHVLPMMRQTVPWFSRSNDSIRTPPPGRGSLILASDLQPPLPPPAIVSTTTEFSSHPRRSYHRPTYRLHLTEASPYFLQKRTYNALQSMLSLPLRYGFRRGLPHRAKSHQSRPFTASPRPYHERDVRPHHEREPYGHNAGAIPFYIRYPPPRERRVPQQPRKTKSRPYPQHFDAYPTSSGGFQDSFPGGYDDSHHYDDQHHEDHDSSPPYPKNYNHRQRSRLQRHHRGQSRPSSFYPYRYKASRSQSVPQKQYRSSAAVRSRGVPPATTTASTRDQLNYPTSEWPSHQPLSSSPPTPISYKTSSPLFRIWAPRHQRYVPPSSSSPSSHHHHHHFHSLPSSPSPPPQRPKQHHGRPQRPQHPQQLPAAGWSPRHPNTVDPSPWEPLRVSKFNADSSQQTSHDDAAAYQSNAEDSVPEATDAAVEEEAQPVTSPADSDE